MAGQWVKDAARDIGDLKNGSGSRSQKKRLQFYNTDTNNSLIMAGQCVRDSQIYKRALFLPPRLWLLDSVLICIIAHTATGRTMYNVHGILYPIWIQNTASVIIGHIIMIQISYIIEFKLRMIVILWIQHFFYLASYTNSKICKLVS